MPDVIPIQLNRRSCESQVEYWVGKLLEAGAQLRIAREAMQNTAELLAKRNDILRAYQLQKPSEETEGPV